MYENIISTRTKNFVHKFCPEPFYSVQVYTTNGIYKWVLAYGAYWRYASKNNYKTQKEAEDNLKFYIKLRQQYNKISDQIDSIVYRVC